MDHFVIKTVSGLEHLRTAFADATEHSKLVWSRVSVKDEYAYANGFTNVTQSFGHLGATIFGGWYDLGPAHVAELVRRPFQSAQVGKCGAALACDCAAQNRRDRNNIAQLHWLDRRRIPVQNAKIGAFAHLNRSHLVVHFENVSCTKRDAVQGLCH